MGLLYGFPNQQTSFKSSFQTIADVRALVLRVEMAEKGIEELIAKSIVTNDVNRLFDVINEASAEIAVMRLELTDIDEKLKSQRETYAYERYSLVLLASTIIKKARSFIFY